MESVAHSVGSFSCDAPAWLDIEGASLIRTLAKTRPDAPQKLMCILGALVEWGSMRGAEHPAAAESWALGIAHLLPVILRFAPELLISVKP